MKRIAATDIREQHFLRTLTLLRIAAVLCIGSRLPNFREGVQSAKGAGGMGERAQRGGGGQKPPGIPGIRGVRAFGCAEPYNEPPQNKGCSSNPVLVPLAFKRVRARASSRSPNHVFSLRYTYIQSIALFTGYGRSLLYVRTYI